MSDPTTAMREEIERGIDAGWHRGGQLVVSIAGERVIDLAVGEASDGVPLTTDTLMLWMSSGKPITALAIAQLVEHGELELDDRVASIIPGFEQGGKGDITLRLILTHTCGFRGATYRYPEHAWDEIIDLLCKTKLERNWMIGETAGYHSHTSWFILGEVVQRITGEPLGDYLRDALLDPIGMTDTYIGIPPEDLARYREANRVSAVTETDSGGRVFDSKLGTDAWLTPSRPSGNAMGPTHQLLNLYEMLLDLPEPIGPPGRFRGREILKPETVERFTAAHRVDTFDKTFKFTMDWGLGFMRSNNRHAPDANLQLVPYGFGPHASDHAFGHSGNQSSTAFADPEHHLAVALVFNGLPGEASHSKRMYRMLELVYSRLWLGRDVSRSRQPE